MESMWGLLGPEFLQSMRRTRTLGLGASVRRFNDLAVPGLGGVWYGKQLLLATLGVAVAEEARSRGAKVQNIEMANAIEALSCWLAFKNNDWSGDARLRGKTKLQGKDDFSFRQVRQRNFYVTQPMRMATVQALPALGFVESDSARFNAFRCIKQIDVFREKHEKTKERFAFVEEVTKAFKPHGRTVIDHLTKWVLGESDKIENSPPLLEVLSPLKPFPQGAIPLLRERLIQGGNETDEDKKRRGNALAWVESLRNEKTASLTWAQRPQEISEEHWYDLQAGALFFKTREAAIATLDAAETYMGNQSTEQSLSLKNKIFDPLKSPIEKLTHAAEEYLNFTSVDEDAKTFCRECVNDEPVSILRALVKRDGHVLRLVGGEIKPGPAFRGSATQVGPDDGEDQETLQTGDTPLPEGISYRVRNLYMLNLDMHGELDEWLSPEQAGVTHES